MDKRIYCMIYELKGLIESMSEMAAHDNEYDNPLIERAEVKIKDIVQEIDKYIGD